MNREYVKSSRICSVGWEDNTLEIEFKDGSIYQYFDVNISEYNTFISSISLGSALSRIDKVHQYIRIR